MNQGISKLLILAVIVLQSCGPEQQQQQQGATAMPYPVAQVKMQKEMKAYKSYPTSVEGINNTEIRPKISGFTERLVDEGEKVSKGQILFRLETQSLSQDAEAAKASVKVAEVEVEKLKPLVEKDIVSEVQLETAKANLAQVKSNYQSISANIGYATIKSPIDGVVGSIPFREGNLVSPTDQMPLTTVSKTEQVYAYFSFNEKDYLDFLSSAEGKTKSEKIANFPEVELILANGETYEFSGKIETISGQINPNTGTVQIRAKFPNPNDILSNGNSGRIRIPQTYENIISVPQLSTFERQGITYVYKLQENNTVKSTPIEIIDKVNQLYLLKSGLHKGDKIVVKGVSKIQNESEIQPQEVDMDSISNDIKTAFK